MTQTTKLLMEKEKGEILSASVLNVCKLGSTTVEADSGTASSIASHHD